VNEGQLLGSKNFGETSLLEIRESWPPKDYASANRWNRASNTNRKFRPHQHTQRRGTGGSEQAGVGTESVGSLTEVHEQVNINTVANWFIGRRTNCWKPKTSA